MQSEKTNTRATPGTTPGTTARTTRKLSDTRASGTRASGTRASGTRASGTRASGTRASGTRASGTKATGTRTTRKSSDTTPIASATTVRATRKSSDTTVRESATTVRASPRAPEKSVLNKTTGLAISDLRAENTKVFHDDDFINGYVEHFGNRALSPKTKQAWWKVNTYMSGKYRNKWFNATQGRDKFYKNFTEGGLFAHTCKGQSGSENWAINDGYKAESFINMPVIILGFDSDDTVRSFSTLRTVNFGSGQKWWYIDTICSCGNDKLCPTKNGVKRGPSGASLMTLILVWMANTMPNNRYKGIILNAINVPPLVQSYKGIGYDFVDKNMEYLINKAIIEKYKAIIDKRNNANKKKRQENEIQFMTDEIEFLKTLLYTKRADNDLVPMYLTLTPNAIDILKNIVQPINDTTLVKTNFLSSLRANPQQLMNNPGLANERNRTFGRVESQQQRDNVGDFEHNRIPYTKKEEFLNNLLNISMSDPFLYKNDNDAKSIFNKLDFLKELVEIILKGDAMTVNNVEKIIRNGIKKKFNSRKKHQIPRVRDVDVEQYKEIIDYHISEILTELDTYIEYLSNNIDNLDLTIINTIYDIEKLPDKLKDVKADIRFINKQPSDDNTVHVMLIAKKLLTNRENQLEVASAIEYENSPNNQHSDRWRVKYSDRLKNAKKRSKRLKKLKKKLQSRRRPQPSSTMTRRRKEIGIIKS